MIKLYMSFKTKSSFPTLTKATKKASFDQRRFRHSWLDVVSLSYCLLMLYRCH